MFSEGPKDNNPQDKPNTAKETVTAIPKAEIEKITSEIKPQYDGEHLTIETIQQICDAILKITGSKYVELTTECRRERRAHKDELRKIIDIWNGYLDNQEKIIDECETEVCKSLGISDSVWANSKVFRGAQSFELTMMLNTLPHKLKMSLQTTRNIALEELKKILRARVDFIKSEDANDSIRDIIQNPEEMLVIPLCKVNDAVFEQYGVEEEDIDAAIKEHGNDPEVNELFGELQRATMKLLGM